MGKKLSYFGILFLSATAMGWANAATRTSQYIQPDTYNYMYPYMNNKMRVDLNPGVTPSQSTNPIDVVVKTKQLSTERRVVPRRGTSAARSATAGTTAQKTNRQVVARRGNNRQNNQYIVQNATDTRSNPNYTARNAQKPTISTTATEKISSSRCLADYSACMDNYCERENTAYNRCYCSSRLSQIDSTYQQKINDLINQILALKTEQTWSDAEMNEYWMEKMGSYVGDNSWVKLENALDIDWADTESRVRGQYAFTTGHEYCVQHLRGCFYMASNLRDAYRSEIARDCSTYEQSLQKIKNAAESIVESYND